MAGPNFFLVGAMRAATTSTFRALSQHPEIFASPIKEPTYFATECRPTAFVSPYKEQLEAHNRDLSPWLR